MDSKFKLTYEFTKNKIDLTSDERDGAKRFILAIKSKVRILKPDAWK